LGESR